MDAEQLQIVLLHTFSSDETQRKQAEAQLNELKAVPGYYILLLHTVTQPYSREIRQAAAIALKNSLKANWQAAEAAVGQGKPVPPQAVRDEEKDPIRDKALEGLINEGDAAVRVLLAEVVHSLILFDYPERWPQLLDTIMLAIHSGNPLYMHNGLLALRKLAKKYEYKPRNQRANLELVISKTFPSLMQLTRSVINNSSLEVAEILRLTLKVFWSSTQFQLPAALSDQELLSWMELLGHMLTQELVEPTDTTHTDAPRQPVEPEDRKRWPWWKVKKWACMIVVRFYNRYGVPRYAEDSRKAFAKIFYNRVAPALLAPMLTLLSLRANGRYCTDRVVHLALQYTSTALEMAPTFKLIKPNLDYLLFSVVFPLLCLKDEDIHLFEHDPHEYIRKMQGSGDLDEICYDPREGALSLVKESVTKRSKTTMPKVLGFIQQILVAYNASPPAQRDYRQKDAALQCLGVLSEVLKSPKRPEFRSQLEGMLVAHVLPEFTSQLGFMRARACWMIRHYADIPFTDSSVLARAITATLNCLCDPCLPVQVESATAIRELAAVKGAEALFVPHLQELLRQYFRLMNEVGSDDVVGALDMLIGHYAKHMAPHACAMANQLHMIFRQYVAEADNDDDKALAATQCLDALNTLVQSVREHKAILHAMEKDIVPVLALVLGPEGEYFEYLENALDLLTCITYYSDDISTEVWQLFPLLYGAFERWAYDYLENMVVPIENYIQRSTHTFLTGHADGVRYVDLALTMAGKMLGDDKSNKYEAAKATIILKAMLHSCKGRIDDHLPVILEVTIKRLLTTKGKGSPTLRLMLSLLEVISSAIYYNPVLALQIIESQGWTLAVFQAWFSHIEFCSTRFSRKQVVLGLTAMLQLPTPSLPDVIRQNLVTIVTELAPMITQLVEDEGERLEQEDGDDEDGGEDDGGEGEGDEDEEGDVADDEDYVDKDDDQYMAALKQLQEKEERKAAVAAARTANGHGDEDDEEEDEESIYDDDDEDREFDSPLQEIDEVVYFHDVIAQMHQREPQVFQHVHQSLSPEVKQYFEALLQQGVERRQKLSMGGAALQNGSDGVAGAAAEGAASRSGKKRQA